MRPENVRFRCSKLFRKRTTVEKPPISDKYFCQKRGVRSWCPYRRTRRGALNHRTRAHWLTSVSKCPSESYRVLTDTALFFYENSIISPVDKRQLTLGFIYLFPPRPVSQGMRGQWSNDLSKQKMSIYAPSVRPSVRLSRCGGGRLDSWKSS